MASQYNCLPFLFAAPLVDSSTGHSSSAMLMLLSVVFVGLAVFLIYKFKRYVEKLAGELAVSKEAWQRDAENPEFRAGEPCSLIWGV